MTWGAKRQVSYLFFLLVILAILGYFFIYPYFQKPSITSISPNSGSVGTLLTIKGSGFKKEDNIVNFELNPSIKFSTVLPSYDDGRTLKVSIPNQREEQTYCSLNAPCLPPRFFAMDLGVYKVSVSNINGTSETMYFNLIDRVHQFDPSIEILEPKAGEILKGGKSYRFSWKIPEGKDFYRVIIYEKDTELMLFSAKDGEDSEGYSYINWALSSSNDYKIRVYAKINAELYFNEVVLNIVP